MLQKGDFIATEDNQANVVIEVKDEKAIIFTREDFRLVEGAREDENGIYTFATQEKIENPFLDEFVRLDNSKKYILTELEVNNQEERIDKLMLKPNDNELILIKDNVTDTQVIKFKGNLAKDEEKIPKTGKYGDFFVYKKSIYAPDGKVYNATHTSSKDIETLKKGDFIAFSGTMTKKEYNGKTYINLIEDTVKLIKAKEQVKTHDSIAINEVKINKGQLEL